MRQVKESGVGEGNHPLSSRVTSGHILTLSGPRICSPSRSDSTGGRHDSLKLREVTIICGNPQGPGEPLSEFCQALGLQGFSTVGNPKSERAVNLERDLQRTPRGTVPQLWLVLSGPQSFP